MLFVMSGQTKLSLAARFTEGVGLVDVSLTDAQQRLDAHCQDQHQKWRLYSETNHYPEAIAFLSTLTFPLTRHVIFATQRGGAALVNNHRDGSTYGGYGHLLPRRLQCRFARIACKPS